MQGGFFVTIRRMQNLTFLELQKKYLRKIYELSKGVSFTQIDQTNKELDDIVEFAGEQYRGLTEQLQRKSWANFEYAGVIWITPDGVEKIQTDMEKTYAEKELLVLKTIYEMGKNKPKNFVNHTDLLYAVEFSYDELNTIITELYRKGFLGESNDESVKISPRGMEFLEGKSNMPAGNNVTNYNIHAPVGAIQHQTQHSTQNVNQQINTVNDSDFDSAINSIIDLVKESSLVNFKKEDLISEIERVKQLRELEPSPELTEHAKSKINYLETLFKAADLFIKAAPFFPHIYAFFEGLSN